MTNTDEILQNDLRDEGNRVILRGELGNDIVWGNLQWGDSSEEKQAAFRERFDIVGDEGYGPKRLMAEEDYYQGLTLMRVIRRRSDGALFGFEYWEDISKHGETYIESNAYENGLRNDPDDEYEIYVFTPVEPFTMTGYRYVEEQK